MFTARFGFQKSWTGSVLKRIRQTTSFENSTFHYNTGVQLKSVFSLATSVFPKERELAMQSNDPRPSGHQPSSSEPTEAASQPACATVNEDLVRNELKKVIDPELFVNIVDLGLVYVVDVVSGSTDPSKSDVHIEMTMTSPMCPAGPQLVANSRQVVEALSGVDQVDVKVVMDPPWTPDRMTEDARDQLNIF
jgi:metal-sulfur cluster biosynthetic enzyme